jgi:hydrogenase maturation factor HypE
MNYYIVSLLANIANKDIVAAKQDISAIEKLVIENDANAIEEMVTPVLLEQIFSALINTFGISRKLLMIKKRSANRKARAFLFCKVILNALTRIEQSE